MMKWSAFLLSLITFAAVHEGMHASAARLYNEFESFNIRPIGFEVKYRTPVGERSGMHWALVAGAGNVVTILAGYALLLFGGKLSILRALFTRTFFCYLTLVLFLADPLNLSIGPFLYGGDAEGVAVGLGVPLYGIQVLFFIVFLVNRELVVRRLFPMYHVQVNHILFRPLVPRGKRDKKAAY
ncbi:MAG: hypothetical protein QHI48_02195 [Bacteroidota bacterium]|nr:hypothetical protein [Bacteroidota bacterium]